MDCEQALDECQDYPITYDSVIEALSLPNLTSPMLNRIKAEAYRDAAEIAGPEDSYQDHWFKAKSDSCAKLREQVEKLTKERDEWKNDAINGGKRSQ